VEPVFFLDFDGVICDSIDECFVSSWVAYHDLTGNRATAVPLTYYRRFRALRPYIRTGADYVLIHRLLETGVDIGDQSEFDAHLEAAGEAVHARYHEAFYRARSTLLETDREYWTRLNRIYAGVHEWLPRIDALSFVVTTKEVSFAVEILAAAGSNWDQRKIYCSGKQRKIPFIRRIMDQWGIDRAVFIDDQIDHLVHEVDDAIDVYLAAWGYVQPEWLTQTQVPVITKAGFLDMLRRFF
jgi:hypothetical protein